MRFIIGAIKVILIFTTSFLGVALGEESLRFVIYNQQAIDAWPDSYYLLYGFGVAAVALFVMAVMKKHDELS